MKIAIGSTSKHKVGALTKACRELQINCTITQIQILNKRMNRQPVSFEQILQYATVRAQLVRRECPEADLCLGIESGILRAQAVTIDLAVIATVMPDKSWYFSTTPGICMPERQVNEAERRGFKTTTVGQTIAETLHGDPTDPQASLTGGIVSRQHLLFTGIYILFVQLRALGLL